MPLNGKSDGAAPHPARVGLGANLLGLPVGILVMNLPVLVGMAAKYRQVPDLFEAYNRVCPPVELPNFLGALSVLLAKGILIDQGSLG